MNIQKIIARAIGVGLNLMSFFVPRRAGRLAFRVFITPPAPLVRPKELAFLATAQRQDRQLANKSVVVYHWAMEDKARPWVLLSYGWGYNAGRWRHFVPGLLAAGYRVTAYDPTGHGQAPKGTLHFVDNMEIISELIRSYGPAKAMIGHSFGGACSVQSLAYLDKSLHPEQMVIMASFSHAERTAFQELRHALGLNDRVYAAFVEEVFSQTDAYNAQSLDVSVAARKLGHVSALLVHDPEDEVTPFREAEAYHTNWPGSTLYAPPGAGHHLGMQEVTDRILSFVGHAGVEKEPVRNV